MKFVYSSVWKFLIVASLIGVCGCSSTRIGKYPTETGYKKADVYITLKPLALLKVDYTGPLRAYPFEKYGAPRSYEDYEANKRTYYKRYIAIIPEGTLIEIEEVKIQDNSFAFNEYMEVLGIARIASGGTYKMNLQGASIKKHGDSSAFDPDPEILQKIEK